MKKLLLAALSVLAVSPVFAGNVGVSVSIGEPGFYGQIDIGNGGRPQLIYNQPILIARPSYGYVEEPMYLRVPEAQSRNWRRYCGNYGACGRQVYFVHNNWYNNVFVPQYRERGREWNNDRAIERHEERREEHFEQRRDERHDERRNDRGDHGDHGDHGNRGDRGGRGDHRD